MPQVPGPHPRCYGQMYFLTLPSRPNPLPAVARRCFPNRRRESCSSLVQLGLRRAGPELAALRHEGAQDPFGLGSAQRPTPSPALSRGALPLGRCPLRLGPCPSERRRDACGLLAQLPARRQQPRRGPLRTCPGRPAGSGQRAGAEGERSRKKGLTGAGYRLCPFLRRCFALLCSSPFPTQPSPRGQSPRSCRVWR